MERPTKEQVEYCLKHTEGWQYTGSETVMPGTGWEKFEVLAAEVRALRKDSLELERQGRWHASYNAALGSNAVSGVEARHINAVHESCAAAADRAHGPLEGTQEPFSEMDLAAHLRHVEALVKAARDLADHYGRDLAQHVTREDEPFILAVDAALKPFETEHGE